MARELQIPTRILTAREINRDLKHASSSGSLEQPTDICGFSGNNVRERVYTWQSRRNGDCQMLHFALHLPGQIVFLRVSASHGKAP